MVFLPWLSWREGTLPVLQGADSSITTCQDKKKEGLSLAWYKPLDA